MLHSTLSHRFVINLLHGALAAILLLLSTACSKKPAHLSESEMEDLLYDLHTAQAIAQQAPSDSIAIYETRYRDAILIKYNITREELEENLLYYTTNADRLYKIYDKLATRLETTPVSDDSDAQLATYTSAGMEGDTINIWQYPTRLLLHASGANRMTFTIAADTLIHPGDRLEWHMTAGSIYPEGERNMQASFRAEYAATAKGAPDSIGTFTRSIGGYGQQVIPISLSPSKQLRNLRITLFQNTTWSEKPKLLLLSHIYLLRIRESKKAESTNTLADSLSTDSTRIDSTTHDTKKDSLPSSGTPIGRHTLTPAHRAISAR